MSQNAEWEILKSVKKNRGTEWAIYEDTLSLSREVLKKIKENSLTINEKIYWKNKLSISIDLVSSINKTHQEKCGCSDNKCSLLMMLKEITNNLLKIKKEVEN